MRREGVLMEVNEVVCCVSSRCLITYRIEHVNRSGVIIEGGGQCVCFVEWVYVAR